MSVKDMIKKSVLKSGVFDQYNILSIFLIHILIQFLVSTLFRL